MSQKIKIAPSVLAADFTRLGQEVKLAEKHGADQIHIDVMDGHFVPNITMGPLIVRAIRRITQLPLDVHLMIEEPERHISSFVKAGASAITVHVEACPHLHRVLQQIQELNARAGVAINPHTPASAITEVLRLADIVLVMTVNPGFGGQAFLTETMPKLAAVRQFVRGTRRPIDIGVDGGVDQKTALQCLRTGANVLVTGTSIFGAEGGVEKGMQIMKKVVADFEEGQAI